MAGKVKVQKTVTMNICTLQIPDITIYTDVFSTYNLPNNFLTDPNAIYSFGTSNLNQFCSFTQGVFSFNPFDS